MSAFDNSQISEEGHEDTQRSELRELNQLREMLPEPITRLDEYLIRQETEQQSHDNSLDSQGQKMMMKIMQQTKMILDLQEKLYYYRNECLKLIDQNQQIKENSRQLQEASKHKENLFIDVQRKLQQEYLKVSHLEKEKRSQQQKIHELTKAIEKNVQRKDREISFRNTYNQELLSKQLLLQQKIIVDLTNKNQKMLKINLFLENQLRMAEEKLINFEIEVQQKMCSILVDNVSRLKENQSNFNKSAQSYTLSDTNYVPKINFASTRPLIEENKTVKIQNTQDLNTYNDEIYHGRQFQTIEKDKILKSMDYKYDYKLVPVDSPKPQRKSNRVQSFNMKKDQKHEHYNQQTKFNF